MQKQTKTPAGKTAAKGNKYADRPRAAVPAAGGGSAAAEAPKRSFELPALLLGLVFALLTLWDFVQTQKWLILVCCLASVVLCALALTKGRLRKGLTLLAAAYALFFLWMAAYILWANSGKLFFREFSKRLYVLPLLLLITLYLPRSAAAVRRLLLVLSTAGAVYALLSVDMATLGLAAPLLNLIPEFFTLNTGFEIGTRLTGIFGNPNISAGLLAVCIFFSLYLIDTGERRFQRGYAAALAALQAYTFLLNFSLGATGFFLLCVLLYLLCAGEKRMDAFLRMLEIAVPTVIAVFLSFRCFERYDILILVPLIAAVLDALVVVLLELLLFPRLRDRAAAMGKRGWLLLAGLLLLLCLYAAFGLLLRGGATLNAGESLRRSCYPAAGEYALELEGSGELYLTVVSQDEQEIVMHMESVLYEGPAENAAFTVPDGSRVVYLTFTATAGTSRLERAVLSGPTRISLHLGYPLLPGFISNRLQGLRANENAIQRLAFFRDGIKVFLDHPVLGAGLGCFESLLYGYQSFHYETKYVHNHYIQILLDCGAVGFLLYLAVLLLTLRILWRARKKETPFRPLYPALCAAFAMMLLHSGMEVVLSAVVYLPFACAVPALIAFCWGEPVEKPVSSRAGNIALGAAALIYAVMIVLNMYAKAEVTRASDSDVRFFSALDRAVKSDAFDRNDWRTSYVVACADLRATAYRGHADRYAEAMLDVPSNSLHQYLLRYYLTFGEYDKALEAARKGAAFNYADSDTWNTFFNTFAAYYDLTPEDGEAILADVRALNEDLLRAQDKLMDSTELNEASREIISLALNG
ncbi:MAG: O-antigen ligase family protein [Oscillospiraceae bacterium]|nr:O-antigen ligase family protein [Oscillospiraceae bacterium]